MARSHRSVVRRWRPASLLIGMLLGTLLLSACAASTAGAGTAPASGTLQWRFQTGGRMGPPAVADGKVYLGVFESPSSSLLYALDASTGAERWRVSTGNQGPASPTIASGVVYIASSGGLFTSLDASTGAVRWQVPISASEDSSPAVANGVVYVGTTNGSLVALDVLTGIVRWHFQPGGSAYFAFSTPAVANGVVYADSEGDQSIYALDASTGALRWRFTTPAPDAATFPSAVAVEQGVVYVVFAHNGIFEQAVSSIYALDASTGAVRWHLHDSKNAYSAPTVTAGVLYVSSTERAVYALDASTGAVRWRSSMDVDGNPWPVLANGVVYVAYYDGSVHALDAQTGAQRWRFQTDGARGMQPTPVVADGAVYVSSSTFLYALGA